MSKLLLFAAIFVIACSAGFCAQLKDKNLNAAFHYYKKSDYKAARYYFNKAKESKPRDEEARLLIYSSKIMDDFAPAFEEIEKEERLIGLNPEDILLRKSLVDKRLALGRSILEKKFYLPMVEPHLLRAAELDPKNLEVFLYLASAYYSAMRYEKAVRSFEKAIRLAPDYLPAYKMAGDACVAIGDFDKAKSFYANLLKKNEAAARFKYDQSEIDDINALMKTLPETYKDIDKLLKEGALDEAQILLKKRLSLNSSDYVALAALGSLYQDRGDRKNAKKLFERSMKIAPDYPIAHLYMARLDYLMRNYDEAIVGFVAFKEKMKRLPKIDDDTKKMYIAALYYMSEAYFALKQYENSRDETLEILKLSPDDQNAHYNLGVYYYIGEHSRSKAYQSFTKAINIDSSSAAAKRARYAIEFIRINPDPRFAPDFSFIDREYRE